LMRCEGSLLFRVDERARGALPKILDREGV
jgi:hypothetical protein